MMFRVLVALISLWMMIPGEAFAETGLKQDLADFKKGFVTGCEQKLRQRNRDELLGLSETRIKNYCRCSSEETVRQLSGNHFEGLLSKNLAPTPEYTNILMKSVKACQGTLLK